MKILITGVSGFVGKYLAQHLSQNDKYTIIGLSRSEVSLPIKCVNFGSLTPSTDYKKILSGVDVVIHLAARVHKLRETSKDPLADFRYSNCATTLNLAMQSENSGVKRFIFISSVKVNGDNTSANQSFCSNDSVDLSTSLAQKKDPYAVSKFESEKGLKSIYAKSKMGVVIIRPPLVYGSGVKGNFNLLLKLTQSSLPLPLKGIANKRSLVFVKNLVSLIALSIEHPNAVGETFLVSDGKDISTTNLIELIYNQFGKKAKMFKLPSFFFKLVLSLIGKQCIYKRLFGNLQVDINQTRKKLGWAPPYTIEEGIYETVNGCK